jgi:uncharacterized phage-like protein YoqJ
MKLFGFTKTIACCFTGHRGIPAADREKIRQRLEKELETLADNGVTLFITGGALGFDTMAALAVFELKKRRKNIKLRLAIPCENQTRGWSDADVALYKDIMDRADQVVYTARKYTAGCMHVRNRYMVDNSDYCIAYKTRESGGTAYTVKYALQKEKKVINIAE